jgi:hypothetical protein
MSRLAVLLLILAMAAGVTAVGAVVLNRTASAGNATAGSSSTDGGNEHCALCL